MLEVKCTLCSKVHYINPDLLVVDEEAKICFSCSLGRMSGKCECGALKAGSRHHADYCPRYGLDIRQHPRKLIFHNDYNSHEDGGKTKTKSTKSKDESPNGSLPDDYEII